MGSILAHMLFYKHYLDTNSTEDNSTEDNSEKDFDTIKDETRLFIKDYYYSRFPEDNNS